MSEGTQKSSTPPDSDEGSTDKNPTLSKKSKQDTWVLENFRKIQIRQFKGKPLIDIREFYVDISGVEKPGKKGIALSVEQFNKLIDVSAEVLENLKYIS